MATFVGGLVQQLLADKFNEMIVKTDILINPTDVAGDEIEMGLGHQG